jgi:hypothetical protein
MRRSCARLAYLPIAPRPLEENYVEGMGRATQAKCAVARMRELNADAKLGPTRLQGQPPSVAVGLVLSHPHSTWWAWCIGAIARAMWMGVGDQLGAAGRGDLAGGPGGCTRQRWRRNKGTPAAREACAPTLVYFHDAHPPLGVQSPRRAPWNPTPPLRGASAALEHAKRGNQKPPARGMPPGASV